MLAKTKTLFAKKEVTYGTDPIPIGSDAILTKNLQITPYQGNKVSRDVDRASLGNDLEFNTGPNIQISFDVELAGSGTKDVAPGYGALLAACGLAETVTATTKVDYDPVSSAFDSVTLYYEISGETVKAVGCRGNVSFSLSTGGMPMASFTFTCLYAAPGASTITPDYSAFKAPIAVTEQNTPTFTLDGYALKAESLTVDLGNTVVYRNVVNGESVIITDRAVSGSITFEAPTLAQKDVYALVESHNGTTLAALAIEHGTVDGSIIGLSAPTLQVSSISHNDSDGILTYTCDLRMIPSSAGDDEIKLTTR